MLRFVSFCFGLFLNAASLDFVLVIHTVIGSFCAFYAVPFGQAVNQSINRAVEWQWLFINWLIDWLTGNENRRSSASSHFPVLIFCHYTQFDVFEVLAVSDFETFTGHLLYHNFYFSFQGSCFWNTRINRWTSSPVRLDPQAHQCTLLVGDGVCRKEILGGEHAAPFSLERSSWSLHYYHPGHPPGFCWHQSFNSRS